MSDDMYTCSKCNRSISYTLNIMKSILSKKYLCHWCYIDELEEKIKEIVDEIEEKIKEIEDE